MHCHAPVPAGPGSPPRSPSVTQRARAAQLGSTAGHGAAPGLGAAAGGAGGAGGGGGGGGDKYKQLATRPLTTLEQGLMDRAKERHKTAIGTPQVRAGRAARTQAEYLRGRVTLVCASYSCFLMVPKPAQRPATRCTPSCQPPPPPSPPAPAPGRPGPLLSPPAPRPRWAARLPATPSCPPPLWWSSATSSWARPSRRRCRSSTGATARTPSGGAFSGGVWGRRLHRRWARTRIEGRDTRRP